MRSASLGLLLFAAGCLPYSPVESPKPPVEMPESYEDEDGQAQLEDDEEPSQALGRWWKRFDDPELNVLMRRTLTENFDLHAAWARLKQADAAAVQAGAPLLPSLSGSVSARRNRFLFAGAFSGQATAVEASIAASYEVDVWGKLHARAKAATLERDAARDDLESVAMTLSANVATTWFDLILQQARRELLEKQLETNELFLELVTLRFEQGQTAALDVYQQRQQVAATRSQLVLVTSAEKALRHQLAVLTGQAPGTLDVSAPDDLPQVPPVPEQGVPADLLFNRPDVRAARRRVAATDHRVGAAIADRFPALQLTASASLQHNSLSEQVLSPLWNLLADLMVPIFEGGRRRAEVERLKGVLHERVANYGNTVVTAIMEVQNALIREQQRRLSVEHLEEQVDASEKQLREARSRYSHGLSDYLPVLTALRTLQSAEQSLLEARRQLLTHRVDLYRAMGGDWPAMLERPVHRKGPS